MAQTLHPDSKGNLRYRFRIQRIGVEMEGAWKAPTNVKRDPATGLILGPMREYPAGIKEDPSVRQFNREMHLQAIGEVASEPLIRADLWAWMTKNIPDLVNITCGLHIHMSFRHELDYQQLMDRTYHDHMLMGLHLWGLKHVAPKHHFWPRLRGTNLFCQDVFHADFQVHFRGGGGGFHDNRYGIVNFPWSQHKTVEIRVLPMFGDLTTGESDLNLNIRAVKRVLNLTEEYLDKKGSTKDVGRVMVALVPKDPILPVSVVKGVDSKMTPGVRFTTYSFRPNDRAPYPLTIAASTKVLREVFPTDPFFTAESVDQSGSALQFPEWFPFSQDHADAQGVELRDLVEAFNAYTPSGGWMNYPNAQQTRDMLAYSRDIWRGRDNERRRQAERQAERNREARLRRDAQAAEFARSIQGVPPLGGASLGGAAQGEIAQPATPVRVGQMTAQQAEQIRNTADRRILEMLQQAPDMVLRRPDGTVEPSPARIWWDSITRTDPPAQPEQPRIEPNLEWLDPPDFDEREE